MDSANGVGNAVVPDIIKKPTERKVGQHLVGYDVNGAQYIVPIQRGQTRLINW